MTDVPAQRRPTAESIRDAATNLTAQIVAYFHDGQKMVNEIIIVPLLIGARVFRTYDAINVLLENGYVSEAAVLTLTQFELRLDLAYTAHDVTHATEWLGHERLDWSVAQKMDKKINSLFDDPDDRAKLGDIFKCLSGIKHGNPAYSALGFPARQSGPGLEISTGEIADEFSGEFSRQIASYSTFQLAWSAQVFNVCTGQYAVVDDSLRQSVRNSYLALEPDEEAFTQYLTKLVANSQGPFGLKRWKREKNSNGDLQGHSVDIVLIIIDPGTPRPSWRIGSCASRARSVHAIPTRKAAAAVGRVGSNGRRPSHEGARAGTKDWPDGYYGAIRAVSAREIV